MLLLATYNGVNGKAEPLPQIGRTAEAQQNNLLYLSEPFLALKNVKADGHDDKNDPKHALEKRSAGEAYNEVKLLVQPGGSSPHADYKRAAVLQDHRYPDEIAASLVRDVQKRSAEAQNNWGQFRAQLHLAPVQRI